MRQRLGQHWLRDPKVIQVMLAAAELTPEDTALEIGPGRGIMTFPLLDRVKRLIAVELDDTLAPRLAARLVHRPAIQVVHADILQVDLDVLAQDPALPQEPRKPIKLLGNLPYSITAPIFEKVLAWPGWETGVFLIQREVAERIAAKPGGKDFGVLSLAVQLFAEPEMIHQVKPGAFIPPPKVRSTVVRLRRKSKLLVHQEDIPSFFDLVHGSFAHRRKTIANSLAMHAEIPRTEVEKWLLREGSDTTRRAEVLGLEEYARLAHPWSVFRREMKLTSPTATSTIRRT